MSMSGSDKRGSVAEINVTPLIDVLLVLLIIFMVIVPASPRGLNALAPEPPNESQPVRVYLSTVEVEVQSNGPGVPIYKINDIVFNKAEVEPQLAAIFAPRQERVLFVKGDKGLDAGEIAEVIDFGHRAQVDNIGLITTRVER